MYKMGILDSIGTYLGDEENRLNLASGFAGISGNPNAGNIQQGLQNRLSVLQDDRKTKAAQELASSKLQLQTEQAMRLIGQEYPDIAQAIQGGFMTPNEGVMEAMRRRNAPAEKEGELVRQYRLAQEQGYQGNFMDFKTAIARAGADQVSIDARSGSEVGTIPQGYELITDKNGNRRLRAISGGEAAQEIEEQVIKDASKQNTVGRTATIVLEDIGRLKDLLTEQTFLDPVTGPIASQVASGVSASARSNAESLVSTIGGNIGFDRLQLMRNESKTGGALGAINAQEMQLLQDVMGSLKLDQSEAQLRYNLERLESIYTAIIEKASAYPNAAKYGFGNNKTPAVSQTSASSKVTNTPPILTWNPTGGPNGKGAFE